VPVALKSKSFDGVADLSAFATVMRALEFTKPQNVPVRYPPAPDGFTIYVVGDIHGRLDLLLDVQRRIDEDKARCVRGHVVEVYLGDYIDRGADPAGVVSRLIDRSDEVHAEFLRGNHEQLLLDFLEGKDCLDQWLLVGGVGTLLSYGLTPGPTFRLLSGAATRRKLGQAIPPEHRRFYEKTGSYIRLGDYLAVHAGIRPEVPLDRQKSSDLLGIRQTFLEFDGDFGFVVVHGHTPVTAPELLPNRINIDTGAFATNRLTCLKIDADGPRVLQDDGLEAHFDGAAPHQAPLIETNMIKADVGDQASVGKDDPYSILGVRRGASSREVRAAYLRHVKALHLDGRVDAPITAERLKVVNDDGFRELKRFSRGRALARKAAHDLYAPRARGLGDRLSDLECFRPARLSFLAAAG
jgi:serine/threonine protein phosphatase 1